MAYITVDEANDHLKLDLEDDGESPATFIDERLADLEDKIETAEEIIIDYLKEYETSWDEVTVPRPIKAAMLLVLGALWEDREGRDDVGDLLREDGPVARLVRRFRDPAIA